MRVEGRNRKTEFFCFQLSQLEQVEREGWFCRRHHNKLQVCSNRVVGPNGDRMCDILTGLVNGSS